jgi:hypothetical protein
MIVGRSEKISFPELNICMSAKIDTGAWRTALHVDGFEIIDGILIFWIGDRSNCFEFKEYETVKVRSSFGVTQERYSIKLKIRIGNKNYKVLVSLTDRNNMKYPCLIGRRFLSRYGLVVDVRKKNINDRN